MGTPHCWHVTTTIMRGNDTTMHSRCCFCGAERSQELRTMPHTPEGHGRWAPKVQVALPPGAPSIPDDAECAARAARPEAESGSPSSEARAAE